MYIVIFKAIVIYILSWEWLRISKIDKFYMEHICLFDWRMLAFLYHYIWSWNVSVCYLVLMEIVYCWKHLSRNISYTFFRQPTSMQYPSLNYKILQRPLLQLLLHNIIILLILHQFNNVHNFRVRYLLQNL